ncbi:MAG TPA: PilN domain-containing protein [Candidatus Acidoferrum sp.]|nr:PilN domain-containing protein [Candidatus Acidoferrum sp.]
MSEQDHRAIDAGQAMRDAFARWRETLTQMAQSALGEAGTAPDQLRAYVEGQTVRLAQGRGEEWKTLGVVAIDGNDSVRRLQTTLSPAPKFRDIAVVFAESTILRPSVNLPYASYDNLRKALHFELERISPVAPDDVFFDFTVRSRDREARTADMALRIIRRDIVSGAVDLCHEAGLGVSAIFLGDDESSADWRAFPVDRRALMKSLARRFAIQILGGVALFLLIAILLAAYLRGAETAEYLADELSSESLRAARVERLQHHIDQATTQLAFLGKQKRAPLFVAVLDDIARILPNGTWLTELSIDGGKIHIAGYSHASADLIGIIDRSGRFTNAQFTAPVTQGSSPDVERFDLTFEIAGAPR